jgi:hypothetical protein
MFNIRGLITFWYFWTGMAYLAVKDNTLFILLADTIIGRNFLHKSIGRRTYHTHKNKGIAVNSMTERFPIHNRYQFPPRGVFDRG